MKKKAKIILLILTLSISSCLYASASDSSSARSSLCADCGNGTVSLTETTYSSWYIAGYQNCSKDNRYRDPIKKRNVSYIYFCTH